ncbi:iron/zinc transporter protein-like protein [Novymonas esmeraldas]|uniref:Iron/zinc transporter protein-like protein n=1 Tax=Novymonas esmeraldas TaxID=1808958 RepID=A0AAW0F125_9TRYP
MAAPPLSVEVALHYLAQHGYTVPAGVSRVVDPPTEAPKKDGTLCTGFTGSYTLGLHIGSIFLILGVSFLGTAIPILGKCIPALVRYPFVFSVAKTAATGVLLSVATIHLIFEGAEAFEEDCVPQVVKNYAPLYFLLALIAVLLMQALDMQLANMAERWMKAKMLEQATANETGSKAGDECRELSAEVEMGIPTIEGRAAAPHAGASEGRRGREEDRASADGDALKPNCEPITPAAAGMTESAVEAAAPRTKLSRENSQHAAQHADAPDVHGHQHLSVAPPMDMGAIRRVISAVCMEFGVTLHSVFVGLTVGLTTDDELRPLIVALVFHQLFEGMAMGSRLADAEFKGSLDIVLALVFSFSAPVGMAAAAIAVSVSPGAMSGGGFATLVGVLDTLCGGILLYLAFTLLLGDFVVDVKFYGADGQPHALLKKVVLFVALWIGMGLMALVGNWL